MTDGNALMAAVSLAVLDAEQEQRTLLQSVVLAARAIFEAAASSMFLLDSATGELVFEAVAGQGEDILIGSRFPASKGIAGWVLDSAQPLIVDSLADDPRFARDIAVSTGYLPTTLMATPVMCDEEPIGVLEVLDSATLQRSPLAQLELLSLFGMQAAAALRIVQRSRAARSLVVAADGEFAELLDVVRLLGSLDGERRRAGLRLFGSMRTLLAAS
jgi:GAF domain-containing protein